MKTRKQRISEASVSLNNILFDQEYLRNLKTQTLKDYVAIKNPDL